MTERHCYRAVSGPVTGPITAYKTWRMPRNIPYLVDNIWEWARPAEYPSRRTAAFASPTKEEALATQPAGTECRVYRVGLPTGWPIAQLPLADAKLHRDIRKITDAVMSALGREWFSLPIERKGGEASLFCPGLHADEVGSIAETSTLLAKLDLRSVVQFWGDVRLFSADSGLIDPSGELFFDVPEQGYTLLDD